MAHSLNLSVLAEGVEAQASFLRLPLPDTACDNHPTLLLVDDEPNILTSLSRLLRREGDRILTATSPNEAFEHLAKQAVQVILSDQRMPEMSGTEFFARVRQLYPETICIVLTGYTDLDSVTGAINCEAIYKFLTKPWNDDQLREQIREAFRRAKDIRPPALLPPLNHE